MISQLLSLIIICLFLLIVSFRGLKCQYLETVCIEWKTLPHSKWALCSCSFKLLSVKMWCILVQGAAQVVSKDAVISVKSPCNLRQITMLFDSNHTVKWLKLWGDSIQITMPCHGTLFYLILNRGAVLADIFWMRIIY